MCLPAFLTWAAVVCCGVGVRRILLLGYEGKSHSGTLLALSPSCQVVPGCLSPFRAHSHSLPAWSRFPSILSSCTLFATLPPIPHVYTFRKHAYSFGFALTIAVSGLSPRLSLTCIHPSLFLSPPCIYLSPLYLSLLSLLFCLSPSCRCTVVVVPSLYRPGLRRCVPHCHLGVPGRWSRGRPFPLHSALFFKAMSSFQGAMIRRS